MKPYVPSFILNDNYLKANFVSCVSSQLQPGPDPNLFLGKFQALYYFIHKYFIVTTEDFLKIEKQYLIIPKILTIHYCYNNFKYPVFSFLLLAHNLFLQFV